MLSELFYWVLNISIIGSFTGLILIGMRKIKKLPRFAIYVLWAIPLIRFWVPFGLANEYSLLNLISRYTTKTVVIFESNPRISMSNYIMGAKRYFPIEYKSSLIARIFDVASVVWIIISAAAIIAAVLLYVLTKSELKNANNVKGNIYTSDKVSAPAVYGIFKPKIILPASIADGDIKYIVKHELVHISRKDNLLRIVAVITACVHWFNPFSWIFLKCFLSDMELACDAKVLKTLDNSKTKEYARAVLTAAQGKAFFASAFGGAKTRVRIENILSYKKLSFLSLFFLATFILALSAVLITNAVG